MPPKTKKRKGVKESEEELLINERLNEIFFKYRQDDSDEEDDSGDAMRTLKLICYEVYLFLSYCFGFQIV